MIFHVMVSVYRLIKSETRPYPAEFRNGQYGGKRGEKCVTEWKPRAIVESANKWLKSKKERKKGNKCYVPLRVLRSLFSEDCCVVKKQNFIAHEEG